MKHRICPGLGPLSVAVFAISGCASDANEHPSNILDIASNDALAYSEGSAWSVIDGVLTPGSGADRTYAYTRQSYADVEISLQIFPQGETNSGVFVRCGDTSKFSPLTCYEFNIWDAHPQQESRTGAIVALAPPQAQVTTQDRWSEVRIRLRGEHLQMWVDGTLTNDVTDNKLQSGHIAFQYGGEHGMVLFRNIRITEI